jgi:hypothetical protein
MARMKRLSPAKNKAKILRDKDTNLSNDDLIDMCSALWQGMEKNITENGQDKQDSFKYK